MQLQILDYHGRDARKDKLELLGFELAHASDEKDAGKKCERGAQEISSAHERISG